MADVHVAQPGLYLPSTGLHLLESDAHHLELIAGEGHRRVGADHRVVEILVVPIRGGAAGALGPREHSPHVGDLARSGHHPGADVDITGRQPRLPHMRRFDDVVVYRDDGGNLDPRLGSRCNHYCTVMGNIPKAPSPSGSLWVNSTFSPSKPRVNAPGR